MKHVLGFIEASISAMRILDRIEKIVDGENSINRLYDISCSIREEIIHIIGQDTNDDDFNNASDEIETNVAKDKELANEILKNMVGIINQSNYTQTSAGGEKYDL